MKIAMLQLRSEAESSQPSHFLPEESGPASFKDAPRSSADQTPAANFAPNSTDAQTVAGTTLVHFGKVDDGVYKGSKPRTDADFEFLRARHIKYILDLELLPTVRNSELKKAKRYGIVLLARRINASPISPSEEHIEHILAVLRDKRYHPIYFHCAFGRDRTSLVAALYKMYFLGLPPENALRYMDDSGYKNSWVRSGLKRYLKKHPHPSSAFKTGEIASGPNAR